MARAGDPKLMMLDEPAAGLSRGERVLLTELLLALDREITLILIEHDMDVALTVAERVTMMHDGRVIVEGTPAEIRANQLVHDLYLGQGSLRPEDGEAMVSRSSPSEPQGVLRAALRSCRACRSRWASSRWRSSAATAWARRRSAWRSWGCMAQAQGSVRFDGAELMGRPPYKIAAAGIGYVPQGRRLFPSLSTEEHLGMLGRGGGPVDEAGDLGAVPATRRAEVRRRRAALGRGAADARHLPRAAGQPEAAAHGRAVGRARADDRRGSRRDLQGARRGRDGPPARSSRTSASRPRWPSGSS